MNFDGGSGRQSKVARIGGAFRDHESRFILAYTGRIGKATCSVAEFIATKRGLEIALTNNWLDILIECDAKSVIDHIRCNIVIKAKVDAKHAREIDELATKLNSLNSVHNHRDAN